MYLSAIVLAAGYGSRLKGKVSKALIEVNRKPLVVYALEVFNSHPQINEIVIAANPANLSGIKKAVKKYCIDKVKNIILGGKERQDSVLNSLKVINRNADLVLIHDAARPFVTNKIISGVIGAAEKIGAAICGVPVKATIKEVSRFQGLKVSKTLDRGKLWEIQTPQVFKKGLILKAYKKFGHISATDDAMLVEKLGRKVYLVMGSYNNIKITTPEDLTIAKAIFQTVSK